MLFCPSPRRLCKRRPVTLPLNEAGASFGAVGVQFHDMAAQFQAASPYVLRLALSRQWAWLPAADPEGFPVGSRYAPIRAKSESVTIGPLSHLGFLPMSIRTPSRSLGHQDHEIVMLRCNIFIAMQYSL